MSRNLGAMTVGYRLLEVPDAAQGVTIPVHLLYACEGRAQEVPFGPYSIEVARDAPIGTGPVVVVSHGTGSTPWTLRGLGMYLAQAGFVVAMLEHPGNRRGDDGLAETPANLANRPRHVRLAIDAVAAIDPRGATTVGVVGHSMGGYTALAVAGGKPLALPNQTEDGKAHPVEVVTDPRVKALVLLAPAVPWFMAPGALHEVEVPILMRVGELDRFAPLHEIVLKGVRDPARIEFAVVPNAGHFSFQSPFPPRMVRADFPPSQDPPGFDRAAYQPVLHAEVESFLRRALWTA